MCHSKNVLKVIFESITFS